MFKNLFILKKGKAPIKILRLFILANVCLLTFVAAFWLHPAATSLLNTTRIINRQQQVYTIYTAQVREYHALQLEILPNRILQYAELTPAMYDVQILAQRHGFEIAQFASTESVSYDAGDGEIFVEIRVRATFVGPYDQITDFTYGLDSGAAFIRNLHIYLPGDGMAGLQVEFSLFGRGE